MRRTAAFALALSASITSANAQSFSNTVFFGDSLTDTGWFLYKPLGSPPSFGLAPPGAGTWTTNPDPGWAQIFSNRFGHSATPSDTPGVGGNNYAIGGARVAVDQGNELSVHTQIANYFASTGGVADPNAIYTFWGGSNDLKKTSSPNIVNPQNLPQLANVAGQAVSEIAQLSAAGARYILVPNTPGLSSGAAAASNSVYDPIQNSSRAFYDQTLWNGLAARGINFIPADDASLINYVLTNPTPFGIAVTGVAACGKVNSYQCTAANYVAPNANKTYFWADGAMAPDGGGHMTGAVQQILSDYFYSLVVAPSQISFLAEAPVKTRLGVVNAIQNQIPLSFGQAGAFHGWASGDVSWLKMTNNAAGFPDDPGTPLATTAGFDYSVTSDWLVGAAFSGLTTTQSFSSGGDYRQDEFAVSVYTAYRRNAFWGSAIGSWGTLHDNVNRQIPLGLTLQSNQGSTDGTNVSFAGEIGYDFTTPIGGALSPAGLSYKAPPTAPALMLTHGPVVGLILQQVYLNGFTETNPSGAPTALSFGSQTRNSAITELGYQASLNCGIWEPYAKVVWDHEAADLNRLVSASLTSIAAPSFTMPAVVLGRDWATGTFGTRVRLGDRLSGYVAVIAELGQNNATTYGAQIGLNLALNPAVVAAKF